MGKRKSGKFIPALHKEQGIKAQKYYKIPQVIRAKSTELTMNFFYINSYILQKPNINTSKTTKLKYLVLHLHLI